MPFPLDPLIDPQLGLDRSEQRTIKRAAWKRWFRDRGHSAMYAVGLALAIGGMLFLPDLIEPMIGGHRWYYTLLWFALYLISLGVLFWVMRRFGYAPAVYAELRRRGHDVCQRCGYFLATLPPDTRTCPECGGPRRAMVQGPADRAHEPRESTPLSD